MPVTKWRHNEKLSEENKMIRRLVFAALAFLGASCVQAQTEIQWWHSMGGALGDKVNDLASKFNASQKDYKVVPVSTGSYPESMTAPRATHRAGKAPPVV